MCQAGMAGAKTWKPERTEVVSAAGGQCERGLRLSAGAVRRGVYGSTEG
jgi:hypothetical protein